MGYREEGKWWVAPANYAEEVRNEFNFAPKIEILETTLRDGEQQPGIVLRREDKVAIAKKLDAAGIHRIEAGTPAVSQEDADAIKEICDLGLNAKIYCFTRNVVSDIELAKKCGVQTGEAIWQAKLKCANLEVVPANFNRYLRFARMMREIYADYTDFIEPFGLDEAWLDVTGHRKSGAEIADEIRNRARKELGLTASVGVSFNKIFAKLGSDMKKPDATTLITPENFREKVWPLPAGDLLFVGPATRRKLAIRNIHTIGDIARADCAALRHALGRNGEMLWIFANGRDASPVRAQGEAELVKSVGNSTTAPRDLICDRDVDLILTVLSESVAERLRAQDLRGDTVSLWIRDCELNGVSCQRKLRRATALAAEIRMCAAALFRERWHWERPVRSLGVCVAGLRPTHGDGQICMFPEANERRYELEGAVEDIRRRFGHYAIGRASLLTDRALSGVNPREEHVIHPEGWRRH